MKRSFRRWPAALAALMVAGSGAVVAAQLGGAAVVNADSAQYVQASNSSSYKYVPGNGSATTTQAISNTGSCKTPTTSSAGIIALSALTYNSPVNGVPYTGPSTAATVGTKQGLTGVCETATPWQIQQGDALVFALGTNALVAGRSIGEAKIPVQLNASNTGAQLTATLVERLGATQVGTQSFSVPANTTTTLDSGLVPGGFSSVELRVTHPGSESTTASVVGTSILYLYRLPQTINFTNTPPASPIVGDSYTVTATGGASGNPVTFSVDASSTSGCTVNSGTGLVMLSGPAGSCIIDANQAGNQIYSPAPQVQQGVTVSRAPQAITFTSTPPATPVPGTTYNVTATGGASGNPVTFSIDGSSTSGCTINTTTNVVTFNAQVGTCVINANQAGNTSYLPAPQAQQSMTEYQTLCGTQTITTTSNDGTDGQVSASFTFQDYQGQPAPVTVCKPYTTFSASANDPVPGLTGNQTVTFGAQPLSTAHLTGTISWSTNSFCTPDGSNNTTQCPTTYVSFDGGSTWQAQTYCSSAQAAGIEWCTTGRSYTYPASGGTVITEDWDGYGDPIFHHG